MTSFFKASTFPELSSFTEALFLIYLALWANFKVDIVSKNEVLAADILAIIKVLLYILKNINLNIYNINHIWFYLEFPPKESFKIKVSLLSL